MACQHIVCRKCQTKMEKNIFENINLEARDSGIRCPVCVTFQSTGCWNYNHWWEQSMDKIIFGGMGYVCQRYYLYTKKREATVQEEMKWILHCTDLRKTKWPNYDILKETESKRYQLLHMLKRPPNMKELKIITDMIIKVMIVSVIHDCFDQSSINQAFNDYLNTLS